MTIARRNASFGIRVPDIATCAIGAVKLPGLDGTVLKKLVPGEMLTVLLCKVTLPTEETAIQLV